MEESLGPDWLAQLLVRGIPPIFIDSTVSEVSFQTERLGWKTDDFLVVCNKTSDDAKKLLGQVKRTFTVSSSDSESVKAFSDFWKDYNNPKFSGESDRLLLVTLRGTDTVKTWTIYSIIFHRVGSFWTATFAFFTTLESSRYPMRL